MNIKKTKGLESNNCFVKVSHSRIEARMRKLFILTFLLILSSCTKEIDVRQLVQRDNLVYEINSTTPYTGRVVEYHKNGQLLQIKNYKEGKRHGLFESYYPTGQLSNRMNYNEGKIDGVWESYSWNGEMEKLIYKDGKRIK